MDLCSVQASQLPLPVSFKSQNLRWKAVEKDS